MQIHVVEHHQTLPHIAEAYSITPEALAGANNLEPDDAPVPGQSLVIPIPGMYYWVLPGDSLSLISSRYDRNADSIAHLNGISLDSALVPGQRLYLPPLVRPEIEIGYALDCTTRTCLSPEQQDLFARMPCVTFLAPYCYCIDPSRGLTPPQYADPLDLLQKHPHEMIMTIANLDCGRFSPAVAHAFLRNTALQDKVLDMALEEAKRLGYQAVFFSFEHMYGEDEQAYTAFIQKAADRFHENGLNIAVALNAKTCDEDINEWTHAQNYRDLGEIVDFVILFAHDLGSQTDLPAATTPMMQVTDVLDYAVSNIPPEKIILTKNVYSYNYLLPSAKSKEAAVPIDSHHALRLAQKNNVHILYDYLAQAPYFYYLDAQGRSHTVWFEDSRSLMATFHLVNIYHLRGLFFWQLGYDFRYGLAMLEDNFIAKPGFA